MKKVTSKSTICKKLLCLQAMSDGYDLETVQTADILSKKIIETHCIKKFLDGQHSSRRQA